MSSSHRLSRRNATGASATPTVPAARNTPDRAAPPSCGGVPPRASRNSRTTRSRSSTRSRSRPRPDSPTPRAPGTRAVPAVLPPARYRHSSSRGDAVSSQPSTAARMTRPLTPNADPSDHTREPTPHSNAKSQNVTRDAGSRGHVNGSLTGRPWFYQPV